uniref:Protein TsetseEP domain-containing protein n=1 Tax=Anopheles epiroticus TaxID=199890 RepID=A0A182PCW9_9DIPT
MKVFTFAAALFLSVMSVSVAQRETSLRVIDALRELHPAYKQLRDVVVQAVAGAKLNSSEVVYKFNIDIASRKELFMQTAIKTEANVLRQVNGQGVSIDTSCLGFLRQSVDVNMNLAGVSFTNCLNNVDASLASEITRVYAELQVNETSFVNLSVYDVFRGQNVFVNPQTIVDRLVEKLSSLQQAPIELTEELAQLVDAFEGRLGEVRAAYTSCLTMNDQLLQTTLGTVLTQLQQICLGTLLPAASTSDPTEATEEPQETEPASEPVPEVPAETEAPPTEQAETEVPSENQPEPPTPGVAFGNTLRQKYKSLESAKMKALLLLALLSVAISAVVADRDETLGLFTQLKRAKKGRFPGAEDDFVSLIQSQLLLAQEEFVRTSINGESTILQEVASAEAQASGSNCVDFIRQKTALMLNLAGVSYASCLNRVDDVLFEKLSDATDGAVSREQYDRANMLNAFRGENIFVDPARIRSKLQERMRATFRLPALSAESLKEIREELDEVKEQFVECMKVARAGLDSSLEGTAKQYNNNMKNLIVLLAIVSIATAARPDAERVITTFKQIAPQIRPVIQEAQTLINAIKGNATNQLAKLHLAIIGKKEEYVQQVIGREDYILQQIGAQRNNSDQLCLGFVRTSSEMNVNLAGVSFTNCINQADDIIKSKLEEYYAFIGNFEQTASLVRLLDVFRGQNVFHSPLPIIERLNAKLDAVRNGNSIISRVDADFMLDQVSNDVMHVQELSVVDKMKLVVCAILLLAGGSHAARPGAQEVIETFREIVPSYLAAVGKDQQQLQTLERQGTDAIAQFHSDIMLAKETFVLSIAQQEDALNGLISAQNLTVADGQCMQFVSTAANQTVNVFGVAYTTCINAADESLNFNVSSYYDTIGELERSVVDVRLLDVFRGDNVFYTPDSIVAKLRRKESELNANSGSNSTVDSEMRDELSAFQADLVKIRERYISCMTVAEMSFRSYVQLARQQLSMICGASLDAASVAV